jgi:polysaccharide export outer membrane protein
MPLASLRLPAQSAPAAKTRGTEYNSRFDFATLYSYFQSHGADTDVGIPYNDIRLGAYGSGSYYFNKSLGLEAAFESHPDGNNDGLFDVEGGPNVRRNLRHFSLFAHGLIGIGLLAGPNTRACCYLGYTYHNPWTWGGPSLTAGGGLDINLARVVSLRLIQVDYTYNNVSFGPPTGGFLVYKNENPLGGRAHLPGLQASIGLVWHFGNITPPSAPSVAPPLPAAGPAVDSANYVIGAEDRIQVTVWKEPNLSATLPVRPDGNISLALIGDVPAAGFTPMQLAADITVRLKKFVTDPVVDVSVLGVNSKRAYMIGEVMHVGPFNISPGMTILQAIATAGGLTPYANLKHIYILRGDPGKQKKIAFDYTKAVKKGDMQGISLLPGDTIVVPD